MRNVERCLLLLLGVLCGIACTAGAQCHFSQGGVGREVTYRFRPEVTADGLVMHVGMEFRAGADGRDVLVLPNEYAGEKLHAVTNLRVVSKGARLLEGKSADSIVIEARKGRMVEIAYDLKKDWTGPLVAPLQFHAVLLPEYFEFTGSNALVRLKQEEGAEETANFDWTELPTNWALATSFGTSAAGEQAGERCQTYSGQWQKVEDGLYAGGDYRIRHFEIGQRPAILAVRGQWTFTDDEAMTQISKVIGMVREFWHDDDFPYFLVTLTPYEENRGGTDGSEFTNSFWLFLQPNGSVRADLPLIAHESFHAWDPKKMGRLTDKDYSDTKWFKEGFTEYYAQLLTYKAGERSAADYVGSLNKDLLLFPQSNDEYVRGRVIALWLDGEIRRESGGKHSLDDVMFAMVKGNAQPMTQARIFATADVYLSADSQALLRKAVEEHGELPAPETAPFVDACFRPALQETPTFDLGFDPRKTHETHMISGVVEGGPAFAAGLRDGQPSGRVSFNKNDPDRMVKIFVRVDGAEKEIDYYPRGKTVMAWKYRASGASCGQQAELK
jgi:predicted metalloprotease with PDZ domain